MPLAPGTRLGPYVITTLIGQGGMGEVDRAHDPRLDRDVAPDGRRFFTTRPLPTPPPQPVTSIHVILNWLEDVNAKLLRRR